MPDRYPRRLLPSSPEPPGARVPYGPELPPEYVPPPRTTDIELPPEPPPVEAPLGFLRPYLEGAVDLVRGGITGATGADDTWGAKLGELATSLPGAGPLAGMAVGRGFFSRIDDLLKRLPTKGVHPNKLRSLLKSGASSEEVAQRKINEFLTAQGERPVTPQAFEAHLKANPAPFPETTVLGAPGGRNRYEEFISRMEQKYGEGYDTDLLAPEERAQQTHLWQQLQRGEESSTSLKTKYSTHTLPGGENYRETLLHLPENKHQGRIDAIGKELESIYKSREFQDMNYPGGGDLDKRIHALTTERDRLKFGEQFTSSHFDQPNVLAHVRHKDRTLAAPPPAMPKMVQPQGEQLAAEGWTVRVDREDPFSGRRQMTLLNPQGEWSGSRGMTSLTPEEYLQDEAVKRGVDAYNEARSAPQGPKGRFLEEVQSDWHQQGKKRGYQPPSTPENDARIAHLREELEQNNRNVSAVNRQLMEASGLYQDALRNSAISNLTPEFAHLRSFGDAARESEPAVRAWRAARERGLTSPGNLHELRTVEEQLQQQLNNAVGRTTELQEELGRLSKPTGVPDAPFKESWPDLALKQQVLEVADSPDLDWIGMTTGRTQAERYDLSKQISKLEYDPKDQRLIAYDHDGSVVISEFTDPTPEALEEYIGKEPALALHKKIQEKEASRAWDREQWSVGHDTDDENYFHIYDPNGEPLHNYDGALEWFRTEEQAQARIDDLLEIEDGGRPSNRPSIEGLDLQVGGEGMTSFYDNLLPKRLEKILKSFGGGPVTRERVDALPTGALRQGNPSLEEAEAWIARLTPEMKARIRKEGIPLMMLPFLLAAGTASQVGTPPPVQPPSPSPKE